MLPMDIQPVGKVRMQSVRDHRKDLSSVGSYSTASMISQSPRPVRGLVATTLLLGTGAYHSAARNAPTPCIRGLVARKLAARIRCVPQRSEERTDTMHPGPGRCFAPARACIRALVGASHLLGHASGDGANEHSVTLPCERAGHSLRSLLAHATVGAAETPQHAKGRRGDRQGARKAARLGACEELQRSTRPPGSPRGCREVTAE